MSVPIDPTVHNAAVVDLRRVLPDPAYPDPQMVDATADAAVELLSHLELAGVRTAIVRPGGTEDVATAVRRLETPLDHVVLIGADADPASREGFAMTVEIADPSAQSASAEDELHRVVASLRELSVTTVERPLSEVPDVDTVWPAIRNLLRIRPASYFLDFDGTLSPIVDDPASATMAADAPSVLGRLGERSTVAIISGRDLADVRERVASDTVWYAGSHGFELAGPDGTRHEHPGAADTLPVLDEAEAEVRERLAPLSGTEVERKRFGIAAHYRRAAGDVAAQVGTVVEDVGSRHDRLLVSGGRKVVELRPALDWDKGRALDWLIDRLELGDTTPVFAGDDLTDEDALRVVQPRGLGIVVRSEEHGDRPTTAHVAVAGPDELVALLSRLADLPDASTEEEGYGDQWWSSTD